MVEQINKPQKLFVTHSSKDKVYMEALTDLFRYIGIPDCSIICTSIPGYGIPGGTDIYAWLSEQFTKCDLHVVFALSHNYYKSPACLNEMGACWVTKTTNTLLLLPNFEYSDIKGCINPNTMGIKLDGDRDELVHRMNEFKDVLIKKFRLSEISAVRWEKHRNNFINTIDQISSKSDNYINHNDESMNIQADYNEHSTFIPVKPAFLLVYAHDWNCQIMKITNLGSPTKIIVGDMDFTPNESKKESAQWQDALDQLVQWGWVKPVGYKGMIYELTGTGFDKAEWLKESMKIDTNNNPIDEIRHFD